MNTEIKNTRRHGKTKLLLQNGLIFHGHNFGSKKPVAGEVVFNTGMTGYPETLTDPSYHGQIVALTYPLQGNYGVPLEDPQLLLPKNFESQQIQISGLLISDYSYEFSHWNASQSLAEWLRKYEVPALCGVDTRELTKILREKGSMLGKIEFDSDNLAYYDPNLDNLVAKVSISQPQSYGSGAKKIALIDCGCKVNIIHSLLNRGVEVWRVPWDYDLSNHQFEGLVISNGPGDPKMCRKTILQIRACISRNIPVFGICLGHQLLALAAGANTYKLKYGHRSQNQPVIEVRTNKCIVTSQNHGFAVDNKTLPREWEPWFLNLNDQTNEGIRHKSGRFRSVQFHPEASPGPVDAGYLFDDFLKMVGV